VRTRSVEEAGKVLTTTRKGATEGTTVDTDLEMEDETRENLKYPGYL
jgi:hypothetical protein